MIHLLNQNLIYGDIKDILELVVQTLKEYVDLDVINLKKII